MRNNLPVSQKELVFSDSQRLISATDRQGNITYCNDEFVAISGFSREQLIGQPHNIVRHPQMPKCIFKLLWERIQSGEEIFAYVVNQAKNGDHYWVFANVTPSFDNNGKIIGYYSVRRKPKSDALKTIQALYATLINAEKSGGVNASVKYLEETLHSKGKNYDEFILSL